MKFLKKVAAFTAIGLSLAACSSSGGGDDAPDRNLGLFFGSNDPEQARNGFDYADADTVLSDLEGQTFTVRVVRATVDEETGEVRQETTDEILEFQDSENLTITLDGKVLNIVDGEAPADDGDVFTLREARTGRAVRAFVLEKGEPNPFEGIEFEIGSSSFLIGAETNPEQIPDSGSVNYSDSFSINPVAGRQEALNVFVSLDADFGSSAISGDVDLRGADFRPLFDLELAPTEIIGNGFAGDLTCSTANCTSNSEIGGVFFGDEAAEIGGLINLDVTTTDSIGGTTNLIGTGAFVATEREAIIGIEAASAGQ